MLTLDFYILFYICYDIYNNILCTFNYFPHKDKK